MAFILDAACMCSRGNARKNNGDNFFFDGRCLEEENKGLKHPVTMMGTLQHEVCVAVFDGMGGENCGGLASFTAADCMRSAVRRLKEYFIPERSFLTAMCTEINAAVLSKQKELKTNSMGTTMAALYFSYNYVYVCNLGDSRAYRLRAGEFLQLSEDHVAKKDVPSAGKAPLTQNLGIDPDEFVIEPYIAKGELRHGDQYLLCSDGLTDMLSNLEIDSIMNSTISAEDCAEKLVKTALVKGGRDNVTVIICRIV